MGAWGSGPFENDSALDFVDEIDSAVDLTRAFDWAKNDYIDVDEASSIVVAAECVAAMCGSAHPGLPEDLAERIRSFERADAALIAQARSALAAVAEDSELVELWDEGDPDEASERFHAEMQGLAARLDNAAQAVS